MLEEAADPSSFLLQIGYDEDVMAGAQAAVLAREVEACAEDNRATGLVSDGYGTALHALSCPLHVRENGPVPSVGNCCPQLPSPSAEPSPIYHGPHGMTTEGDIPTKGTQPKAPAKGQHSPFTGC